VSGSGARLDAAGVRNSRLAATVQPVTRFVADFRWGGTLVSTSEPTRVLRGRCNSEPAVIVRDPGRGQYLGRLTWWNSGTDGESPDGRRTRSAGALRRPGDAACRRPPRVRVRVRWLS
jgi:hypothetical protein